MNRLPTGFAEAWLAEDTSALNIAKVTPKQFKVARNLAARFFALGQEHKRKQLKVDMEPSADDLERIAVSLTTLADDLRNKRARVLRGGICLSTEAGNLRLTSDLTAGGYE